MGLKNPSLKFPLEDMMLSFLASEMKRVCVMMSKSIALRKGKRFNIKKNVRTGELMLEMDMEMGKF